MLRLIQKWLNAGVMEKGTRTTSTRGTPQGATISPLLANLYLHYVFDLWIQQWRSRHAHGNVIVVRYADDIVVGFEKQSDAVRFLGELRDRFRKFELELHPDKTRLIEFGRYAAERRARRGLGAPETFEFLGFTHISGKARSGSYLLLRQTTRKRMRVRLGAIRIETRRRRHLSIKAQGEWLRSVVGGYFAYHAVPTNYPAVNAFRREVVRHWYKALRRRSQRDRMNWRRMKALAERWLPKARILHPWPTERFDVRTQGRSRVR
jgi:hypothetical protein